jgi:hypothetical protein
VGLVELGARAEADLASFVAAAGRIEASAVSGPTDGIVCLADGTACLDQGPPTG